jgi:hypothetical protein
MTADSVWALFTSSMTDFGEAEPSDSREMDDALEIERHKYPYSVSKLAFYSVSKLALIS